MTPFLEIVAEDLFSKFGEKISEVTLVFPSRRAALFFNTYLSKLISKPIWSPSVTTINDIMQQVSGLSLDDPIRLVTKLYNIFNRVKGSNEPFENFYFWGEVMLADFDQVDKYLVNPNQLFTNIKDIKDIEEQFGELTSEQAQVLKEYLGVINTDKVTDIRRNYLSIWEKLLEIYTLFWKELENEKLGYEGMIYRKAVDNLKNPETFHTLPNPIAFIGFNALNECEKVLLNSFKKEGNALFYWDYDPEFIDNPNHEAGMFIRKNLVQFPNALNREVFVEGTSGEKKIKMIAAPSTVAQTKIVPRLLDEMKANGAQLDISTAIIFPKENILIPTLQALPSSLEALNITMGYPIKETPAFSLVDFLIRLQQNAQISKELSVNFYHRDILAILNHPYVRLVDPESTHNITIGLRRRNRIYTNQNDLHNSSLTSQIFSYQTDEDIVAYLLEVCKEIAKRVASIINESENNQLRIDLEFLYALHKSLTRIKGVVSKLDFNISPKVFMQLIRKVFAQERVSFTGEPLAGLQIMGFLETRALDFENLIILSFNDEILPGRNHPVSFITPSLRIAYGLPNYKHHDAVYAYYFYRLLNRAKRVYLIYSGRAEGLSSGEKSRFGLQLEMEQMIGEIETIPVKYNLSLTPSTPITVKKTPEVIENLLMNLNKEDKGVTLSPSGLTTYLMCPLRFYFRYVVKIYEEDEVIEEVGALEFGKIIHSTMEELYKSINGKIVTAEMVKAILFKPNLVEETLDNVFNEIFLKEFNAKSDGLSGRNILARNAMLYTIKKMLKVDADRAPFQLVSHEQEVYVKLEMDITEPVSRIQLGGFVDRIEINNGTVWSIDYKTGKHKDKGRFGSVDELFDPTKINNCKEVFQTFCYGLALKQIYPNSSIKPALWFVKAAKDKSDFDIKYGKGKNLKPVDDFREYEQEFVEGLKRLLSEIFSPNIPFSQTTDEDKCKTCPFIGICGRE